MLQQPND